MTGSRISPNTHRHLTHLQFDATSSKALWEVEVVSDIVTYGGYARVGV